jgi:hypothetical protein
MADLLKESLLFREVLVVQPPNFLSCRLLWQELATQFRIACNDTMEVRFLLRWREGRLP